MNKVTTAQQRKIHALARELGMDDDLLHEYVSMLTEKQSLKDLTVMEAVKVIDAMEGKKGLCGRRPDQLEAGTLHRMPNGTA